MEVMLLRYLDLNHVPVRLDVCSDSCQAEVLRFYRDYQVKLEKTLDEEYVDTIKQANTPLTLSDGAEATRRDVHSIARCSRNKRGNKKCAIM